MKRDTLAAIGILLLRLVAGFGMATHGYQKVFGGHMEQFTEGVRALGFPLPLVFAWLAALSELLGGILVALGLKARVAAAFAFVTMAVAAFVQHAGDPFAARELAMLYLACFGAIMLIGAGKFSLDRS